jgi:hypothetical protein
LPWARLRTIANAPRRWTAPRRAAARHITHKQRGLRDMADNEDWLDGKPGTGIRPEKANSE